MNSVGRLVFGIIDNTEESCFLTEYILSVKEIARYPYHFEDLNYHQHSPACALTILTGWGSGSHSSAHHLSRTITRNRTIKTPP